MLVSSSSLIEASRAASAAFSAASNASLRAEATFSSLSLLASASIFTCDITRFASSDSGDSDETESGLRSLPFASSTSFCRTVTAWASSALVAVSDAT